MEDFTGVLNMIVPIVLIAIGIACVVLIIELIKTIKVARTTLSDSYVHLDPTLANVKIMTDDIKPTVAKIEPIVDRVQLTLDAVNLEMMRVDEILEDISQITDSAAGATAAAETIANAPVKAVSNVATRVRTKLGSKAASEESAQLADQGVSVEEALEDFRAAAAAEEEAANAAADAEKAEPSGAADAEQALAAMDALVNKADADDASVNAEQLFENAEETAKEL